MPEHRMIPRRLLLPDDKTQRWAQAVMTLRPCRHGMHSGQKMVMQMSPERMHRQSELVVYLSCLDAVACK